MNMHVSPGAGLRPIKREKTIVSIRQLIEWAFQKEFASIDLSREGRYGGEPRPTCSLEYMLIEQARLGCKVDGGGKSDPHPDADLVADALAAMPISCGGIKTGIWIAELARAGMAPDWMPGATPRCVPVGWRTNQHGRHAVTQKAGEEEYWCNGRYHKHLRRMCPVTYSPTAAQIASARRSYLDWWRALLELRTSLQVGGGLTAFEVNSRMPDMSPWECSETDRI